MISRKLSSSHNDTLMDPEGRFITVSISIQNIELFIARIYNNFPFLFHFTLRTYNRRGLQNWYVNPEINRLSTTPSHPKWKSTHIPIQMLASAVQSDLSILHSGNSFFSHKSSIYTLAWTTFNLAGLL